MHPILFRVPLPWGGHFDIATYGVMMALGVIAGIIVALRLGKRDGLSADTVIDVAFWAVIAGVIGAKLWFIVQFWGDFDNKWELLENFRSGLVYYGGLVGGTLAVVVYTRLKGVSLLKTIDVVAPGGALGLAFGRLGCFFNGCCYGRLSDGPLGVCFARVVEGDQIIGSPAYVDQLTSGVITAANGASAPVLPTQLFESAGALTVFALLLLLRRTRRVYGEQTALLFMLYPVVRFTDEFFRGDHGPVLAGLTIPQVFSVAAFATGAATLVWLRRTRPAGLLVAQAAPTADKGTTKGKRRG